MRLSSTAARRGRRSRRRVALAAAACGSSSELAAAVGGGKASAPGVTETTVTIGSALPADRPGRAGLQRDPAGDDGVLRLRQRRTAASTAARSTTSYGRRLQPDQHRQRRRKQLVLQDKVFAIFNGLGTPTHTKVVDFLNASQVPDLFVASGCLCWDDPKAHP